MNFSIIIPVAKKDSRYLKRALLSLQDQDLETWEAIVVFDGYKNYDVIKDDRIKYITIDKAPNASVVRNKGAVYANNEIFFFMDADCILFPGMLKLVADRFESEKVDFVYSGYRFNHNTLSVFPSRPFNPYLLESMNYICTMTPMKREVFKKVGGFREDLDFFQDWDFFLRAVKDHNFKGYYLKDYMFQTEVPNKLSISGNPKYKFEDKVKRIEEVNNLPKRDIVVTTLSAPHQSVERAKALNAKYIGMHNGSALTQVPSQFFSELDTVILQGFFPNAVEDHIRVFPQKCFKVINWIGTDVWQMRNKFNWENIQFIKDNYLSQIDLQLCNSYSLQEELKEIGIDAEVVYQPLTEKIYVSEKPKKPVISAYCSHGHPLHSEFFITDLAKSMPDIDFVLFGTKFKDVVRGNIRYMDFVPVQKAIDLSTMHIRITKHDGFPHTPIQFAMAGRRVITNYKMKYCDYVEGIPSENTWEEMKKNLVSYIRKNINVDVSHDVDECRNYYKDLCCPEKYKNIMLEKINKAKEERDEKENSNNLRSA